MPDQKPDSPKEPETLVPRPCFTLFDMLHFTITFAAAIQAAILLGNRLGGFFGLLAFIVTAVVLFYALGYLTAAFVLFLHRRYSPQSRIGYVAACYVISHFKRDS